MSTIYTRKFDLKASLTDAEVGEFWKLGRNELTPAFNKLEGSGSIKFLSGAGALRADLSAVWEMDDSSVYEKALHNPELGDMVRRFYAAMDLRTSTQTFQRQITPELVQAIGK